jgi:lipopolysaccharide/colanic/teichoic acid biosynthesis glycosyltransferase
VKYPYAASVEEAKEKLQYDLYYVRHLSILLDIYVLLLTARVVLFGRGAR